LQGVLCCGGCRSATKPTFSFLFLSVANPYSIDMPEKRKGFSANNNVFE